MGIQDPEKMDRKAYWQRYQEWVYLRQLDRNFYLGILRQVISETFGRESRED